MNLLKIIPNKEKAESILKMVDTTLEMIEQIDKIKFTSNVTKDYYDVIRELISVILLLDGYKVIGKNAHKKLIEYLQKNCKEFNDYEISLIDKLRILRNRISYDGFNILPSYLERNEMFYMQIIKKLKKLVKDKLKDG